jgi:carbon storage regulator CsrA
MLVLSRRPGEKINIPCIGASVQVLSISGGTVRLGIEAPGEVVVLRAEPRDARALERPVDSDSILCGDAF